MEFFCDKKENKKLFSYFYKGKYQTYEDEEDFKRISSLPFRFEIEAISDVDFANSFEDVVVKTKTRVKQCAFLNVKLFNISGQFFTKQTSFLDIVRESKINIFNSDIFDINFWLHDTKAILKIKRVTIIFAPKTQIFMN